MLTPAAQYLRSSTRVQDQSLEMQRTAISQYAADHGFAVVRSYADAGRSGLTLKHRPGLRQLLHDVVSGNANYRAILVYDVSRWGRFQDTDESAHYEFLCKAAKAPVYYCAESFTHENRIQEAMLKTLKRAMAGEYSREQSAKVFRGQKRLVEMGFRVGGCAGYALRRMMISADGKRRAVLEQGQYKTLATDRVVLVQGPNTEVARVRQIYKLALQGKSPRAIAGELSLQGVPYCNGRPWQACVIEDILSNPKYAGWYIWNQTSKSLAAGYKNRPIQKWVIKSNALRPIIDQRTFVQVQQLRHPFHPRRTERELLSMMTALLKRHGKLNAALMEAHCPGLAWQCSRRFGGLRYAYKLIGYDGRSESFKGLGGHLRGLILRDSVVEQIRHLFPDTITIFYRFGDVRPLVQTSTGPLIGLRLCRLDATRKAPPRWHFCVGKCQQEDQLLIGLMNEQSRAVNSYYLLPRVTLSIADHRLRTDDPLLSQALRLRDLSELYDCSTKLATLCN